jgi:hypothetical protein
VPAAQGVHALQSRTAEVLTAHSTHPLTLSPAHPALHRHTEMFVCNGLSAQEFAGHAVHWLMLNWSVYVPGGHPQHSVTVPRVAYPGLQTPQPVAAVLLKQSHINLIIFLTSSNIKNSLTISVGIFFK